jgi:hypothetical protein
MKIIQREDTPSLKILIAALILTMMNKTTVTNPVTITKAQCVGKFNESSTTF